MAIIGLARLESLRSVLDPGVEKTAHTINEHVLLDDMVSATEFYAYLPKMLKDI